MLKAGVNYIDTANYEPEDTDDPTWRAIYEETLQGRGLHRILRLFLAVGISGRIQEAGLMALLGGTGFDQASQASSPRMR